MLDEMKEMILRAYPTRDPWAHKGDFGYVMIIAGSKKYSGSPIFNAVAALRTGADVIVVRGHPRAMDISAQYAPDIITEPFDDEFSLSDVDHVLNDLPTYQSLILGCGIERSERSFDAMRRLIEGSTIPMVLDAEAIRAVVGHYEVLKGKNVILTPNTEEFRVLTGETVGPNENERKEKVQKWANLLGATILLKGNSDIIAHGARVYVNKTGSPYMTKGGFGDVLTGITGAIFARTKDPFIAACVAAYLSGKAGEHASGEHGWGVLASDMFTTIPLIVQRIQSEKK